MQIFFFKVLRSSGCNKKKIGTKEEIIRKLYLDAVNFLMLLEFVQFFYYSQICQKLKKLVKLYLR